jgi:hypothetical protein
MMTIRRVLPLGGRASSTQPRRIHGEIGIGLSALGQGAKSTESSTGGARSAFWLITLEYHRAQHLGQGAT